MKLFWILLICSPVFSASNSHKSFFTIEAGAYMTNIKERLEAPSGYASEVSSFKGFLRFHGGLHIKKGWYFEPAFGTMLPPRSDADGYAKVFISHLDLNLGIPLTSFLRFRVGPGLEWNYLISKEEDVSLGNGTGSTAFPKPDRSTHVILCTVQGGFSLIVTKKFGLYLDVYVPEIMSRLRRRYHASLTLGFTL